MDFFWIGIFYFRINNKAIHVGFSNQFNLTKTINIFFDNQVKLAFFALCYSTGFNLNVNTIVIVSIVRILPL